jgi:RNA polymerase sigma-54 factor
MRLAPSIVQKLRQIPTEHLVQVAKLLEVQIPELAQAIRQMAEENPCISIEEQPDEMESIESERKDDPIRDIAKLGSSHILRRSSSTDEDDDKEVQYEAPKVSFWAYLESQFELAFPNGDEDREVAYAIIETLDDDGLLRVGTAQLASELDRPVEDVERVRKKILHFDPPGVGAVDAKELCLVQLEDQGFKEAPVYKLFKRHWNLLVEKGPERTIRQLGYSEEQAQEIMSAFRWVYGSPRDMYGEGKPSYVYPEVFIKLVEDELVVEVTERGLPRVYKNPAAEKALEDPSTTPEQKKELRERMRRALDFFKALYERKENIKRVAEFVVEFQESFLRGKTRHVVPITQTEAAERLKLHISTLNRVVKGRWADTPVGVYELRSFFTKGVETPKGQVSHEFMMDKIRQFVEAEDKRHPLTDREIAEKLHEEIEITLKRRSITEYRQRLGIPKCSKRRVRT